MRLIQHIIKNKENLQEMERQLLKIEYKYYLMFDIAVNTGPKYRRHITIKSYRFKR